MQKKIFNNIILVRKEYRKIIKNSIPKILLITKIALSFFSLKEYFWFIYINNIKIYTYIINLKNKEYKCKLK